MVTLVTPAGTVNCCSAPVKSNVCEPVIGVGEGVAVGPVVGVAVGVAVGPVVAVAVAVGTAVGVGDWASTGVGATIEWITGSSAATMPSLRNSRRGSTLRLAGLTTSSANKCACSSLLSVSQTSSSACATFSSAASVVAICCGLVRPSQSCQTSAAVGLSAWTSLRCQS
jgi:hypothetical protein